jgi:hypothetical protein
LFTAAQWARLRALLAVPPDWPDAKVPGALLAALEAAETLNDEFEYLHSAVRLGWVGWELNDLPPAAE